MIENKETSPAGQEDVNASSVNIKDLIHLCLSKWYWFAISIVTCLIIGFYIVMKTTPTYERDALIQIRDDNHGASMNNDFANTFADLGMFSSSADIYNELVAIKSPRLLSRVVDNLDLNVNYTTKKGLKKLPVYGKKRPFIADFVEPKYGSITLQIEIPAGDTIATLTDFRATDKSGAKLEFDDEIKFHMATIDTIDTPIGRILIKPNANYVLPAEPKDQTIKVSYQSPDIATENLLTRIKAELADEHATVIRLSIVDTSAERAEDILNNLIEVYNQSWVDDRNQLARATSRFINQRLVSLESELSDVDSDISSFKSQNLLPDIDEASTLYMQQASKTSDEILDLNNQLTMARYVHDYLSNPSHVTSMMPANSGTGTAAIDNQINEYNKLMLERNNLASSSSDNHPRVRQYDASLAEMRSAVLTAIDNQIVALNTAISNLRRSQESATARIAANPSQAKYLLSVGRQQKVKESLYLYLLQKREENELGQTFAPYNTRILQDATGRRSPIAPRKAMIMFASLLFGFAIPFGIIYINEMLNTRIRSRRDIEHLSIPFMGEIPYINKISKFKRTKDVPLGIKVAHGKSDAINEAFRMMRSNLEFMTRSDETITKVIMITSAIPSSGKTFISMNLAASLALKNKKVLLIDLDLRRHSLSNMLAEKVRQGISTYLSGAAEITNLISHDIDGHANLDFIAAGPVPPNPAELIGTKRFETLIQKAREDYDYVIIDCPPTEAVEDARTIAQQTDMTIFVVRINNLDRSFLPELERMNREKRYSRMGLVLNGSLTNSSYGYRYGYRYGYNYNLK